MSDALAKFGWKITREGLAYVNTPFGSYGVQEYPGYGWRWFYCFDTYYDHDSLACEDMAHGMSLAEEHWRDRVQPVTKPLTDRIEELEAKLARAVEALGTALSEMVDYADTHPAWSEIWEAREAARTTLADLTGGKDVG